MSKQEKKKQTVEKAILIPFNSKGEILLQDRTEHKPPPWGFFGGTVEQGESVREALDREIMEELSLDISQEDLIEIGRFPIIPLEGELKIPHFSNSFLWFFGDRNLNDLELMEGNDMKFVDIDEAKKLIALLDEEKELEHASILINRFLKNEATTS